MNFRERKIPFNNHGVAFYRKKVKGSFFSIVICFHNSDGKLVLIFIHVFLSIFPVNVSDIASVLFV